MVSVAGLGVQLRDRGSFRLGIADLDKRFVAAVNQLTLAAGTCSGTVAVTGTVPVVPGSGTGTYTAVGGSFSLTITLDEILPATNCTTSGPSSRKPS
jgi:hypothetical protein